MKLYYNSIEGKKNENYNFIIISKRYTSPILHNLTQFFFFFFKIQPYTILNFFFQLLTTTINEFATLILK